MWEKCILVKSTSERERKKSEIKNPKRKEKQVTNRAIKCTAESLIGVAFVTFKVFVWWFVGLLFTEK